jgi:outer membrane protein TolC
MAEQRIGDSLGLGRAVVFRAQGGPLDEPEVPSASAAAADILPLAQAVARAVRTAPGLQAALARVRVAMADADQVRLLPNPILSLSLRWGGGAPRVEAGLTEELLRALQAPRRASAADHRLRQAAADAVTAALDVAAEVQERYVTAQSLTALLPILEERRRLMERLVSAARARLDAGEGSLPGVLALEAQLVELEVEAADARREMGAERFIARLTETPSERRRGRFMVPPPGEERAEPLTGEAWIALGLRRRPECSPRPGP